MYLNKPHLLEVGSDRYTVTARKKKIDHIEALLETLSYVDLDNVNLSLFDYGCGFGYSISLARELGIDAFGVDIDRERLSVCESLGLKVSEPGEFSVKYNDVKADIILCQNNLEHLVDLPGTMEYLKARSKPGTVLYINGLTPEVINIEKRRGKFVNAHFVEHINFFPIRTLDRFMARYGFRPQKYTLSMQIRTIQDTFMGIAKQFIQNTLGRNPLTGSFKRIYKCDPEG
jgi:SAM-dependent methyltransferase